MSVMTMSPPGSGPDISDVLPRARQMARELGVVPGRNQIKDSFRVGSKKATAVWRALLAEYTGPGPTAKPTRTRTTEPTASPEPSPATEPSEPPAPAVSPAAPDPVSPASEPRPDAAPLGVLDPDDTDPTWVGSSPVSPGPVGPGGPTPDPDDGDWLDPWQQSEPVQPLPVPSPVSPAALDPGPTRAHREPTGPDRTRQPEPTASPDPSPGRPVKPFPRWPLIILAAGAFVAVWSGWVGIGRLTGFGLVNLLPGIVADGKWSTIDTAITLPLGVEAYGAYALAAFLSGRIPQRARKFAGRSAAGSLLVGAAGQAAYHLLVSHPAWLTTAADGTQSAPVPVVVAVSTLPVAVLGLGAALTHLMRSEES